MMRKDRTGAGPLYLYGYGAYGIAIGPGFRRHGSASSIAAWPLRSPISGADDLGRRWYKDGKLDKRTNTFNDFVDVARPCRTRPYGTGPDRDCRGSAGGELMGAVINTDPDLWGAVVAHVPSSTCSTPCSTKPCR
jgi:oligopeptidase B